MNIGIFGLGVMGKSLVLNFINKGFHVAVYNLPMPGEERVVENFIKSKPSPSLFGANSISNFVENLERPRKILLMVKSGAPVDSVIEQLLHHLEKEDIIIDGGNSFFKDTIRREKELAGKGIYYVGMGVSGGEKGALLGPSMMPAGSAKVESQLMPFFEKVAAQCEGRPCVSWIGENGAGHFVKMIHNGIEYADMQILSEAYSILKNICGLENEEIASHFSSWKDMLHDSYLLDITVQILNFKENNEPILEKILDIAGHKGTGLWTVKEALDLGVAAPSITAAMNARILSGQKSLREKLSEKKRLESTVSPELVNQILLLLQEGILAARLLALTEGFHLMKVASKKYDWELKLSEIAKIWRAGCIIRSKMLPLVSEIFEKEPSIEHLFQSPDFRRQLDKPVSALQKLIAGLSTQHIPYPCLSAALQYYQSMHQGYSAINLIQAQRDFFGAHGYRKIDKGKESFHTDWETL